MEFASLKEYIDFINQDPDPADIKKNEDGSEYIPISIMQKKLDTVYKGLWDFSLDREFFGKSQDTASGSITCWIKGSEIRRNGTAGIAKTGDMKMDYPRLEAMVLLNAAKKLGRWFGRDLNRDREDAPLPITQIKDNGEGDENINAKYEAVKREIIQTTYYEDAKLMLDESEFRHTIELKHLIKDKPKKQ